MRRYQTLCVSFSVVAGITTLCCYSSSAAATGTASATTSLTTNTVIAASTAAAAAFAHHHRPKRRRRRAAASSSSQHFFTSNVLLPSLQPKRETTFEQHPTNKQQQTKQQQYPDKQRRRPNNKRFIPPPLPVMYTNDPNQVDRWLRKNVPTNACSTLGFDVESVGSLPWRKSTYSGPAVVQLATRDSALVVQLTNSKGRYSRSCQNVLSAVLENNHIVKVGCGVDDDMLELKKVWQGLEGLRRFDLTLLRDQSSQAGQQPGLKKLASAILDVHLPKSKKIAMSDWSLPLSSKQLAYAARDAWVGAAVAEELAALDPDTFGTEALLYRLQSEPMLLDVQRRRTSRKQARMLLQSLLAAHKRENNSIDHQSIPSWKLELMKELKDTMHENNPNVGLVFDVKPSLGFHLQNPKDLARL